MRIAICMPVYNDWISAMTLVDRLDLIANGSPHQLEVFLIDDASTDPVPAQVREPKHLCAVRLLRLRRNLGHQRAIAIALTYAHAEHDHDAVLVMDADGEDRASDVLALITACERSNWTSAVFAQRVKRSEGTAFRAGYLAFKAVHFLLVGRTVDIGNFSILPRFVLARLVAVAEIWNHYAAAVAHARLPLTKIPLDRGTRIAGRSKMNFTSLVTHGLSAISVYSDVVGVRLLAFTALATAAVVVGIFVVLAVRFGTTLAVPGWATSALGTLFASLLSLVVISMIMALFTLQQRSQYGFLPLRDFRHYLLDCTTLSGHATEPRHA